MDVLKKRHPCSVRASRLLDCCTVVDKKERLARGVTYIHFSANKVQQHQSRYQYIQTSQDNTILFHSFEVCSAYVNKLSITILLESRHLQFTCLVLLYIAMLLHRRQFGCASRGEREVTAVLLRQWDEEGNGMKGTMGQRRQRILSEVVLYKATTHIVVEH